MPGIGQSVFARFFLPFNPLASAGSAVHLGSDPLELLDHEPPARRRLQRDLQPVAPEPSEYSAPPPDLPANLHGTPRRSTGSIDSAEICARC